MKILEVNNIRKEFGTLVAVNDVCFSLEKGQVLGLIGPNGAGKTTLLRMLATLLAPTDGNAQLLGCDLKKAYLDMRKHIAFLPDFFNLYNDLTLAECLQFFAYAYNVEPALIPARVDSTLNCIGLEGKRNDFVRHLSRGMVQRLGVGVLLVRDPDLFLLDEPASGLDPTARIQLRQILKTLSAEGKTIIISSHILTELSGFCSHIAIMNEGNLVLFGAVDQIQQEISGCRKVFVSVLDDCQSAVAVIDQFPNAQTIAVADNTITVHVTGGLHELAELNTRLVQKGLKVTGFSEKTADLEDLFMKISAKNQTPDSRK